VISIIDKIKLLIKAHIPNKYCLRLISKQRKLAESFGRSSTDIKSIADPVEIFTGYCYSSARQHRSNARGKPSSLSNAGYTKRHIASTLPEGFETAVVNCGVSEIATAFR
jgi:hypothetical protein